MAEPLVRPWTLDAFFGWQERQPDRYELVNGSPLHMRAIYDGVEFPPAPHLAGTEPTR